MSAPLNDDKRPIAGLACKAGRDIGAAALLRPGLDWLVAPAAEN